MTETNVASAPGPASPRRPLPRWARWLIWIFAIILVLMLLAWQVLPRVARWQGEKQLSELLGRPVTIGAIEFLPWSLELTVRDFSIAGTTAQQPPLLSVQRLYADVKAASFWKLAPIVESAELDAPVVHVARLSEGHYDIDDLLKRLAPKPSAEPSKPVHFSLNNLQLHDGALSFDDKPVNRVHELKQLQVAVPFLSNLPSDVEIKVQPRLAFTLNDATFDSGAQATPFAKDRAGTVQVHIGENGKGELDLAPYLGYLPNTLPVRLTKGKVGADLDLQFALQADGSPTLTIKGDARVADIALTDPAGAPLLSLGKFAVALTEVAPLRRKLHFGAVQLDGLTVQVSRDAKGELSVQKLLAKAPDDAPPPSATAASAAASTATSASDAASSASATAAASAASAPTVAPAEPWDIEVASVQLNGSRIDWKDESVQPASTATIDELTIATKTIRWPDLAPVPVTLTAALHSKDIADAGRVSISGEASDKLARMQLELTGFTLPALAPYIAPYLEPKVDGRLDLRGKLDWAAGDAPQLKVGVDEATLASLRLVDAHPAPATGKTPAASADLLTLQRLRLADVDIDLLGKHAVIGSLGLQAPVVKIARDKEGQWNVLQWLPGNKTADKTSAGTADSTAGKASEKPKGDDKPAPAPSGWLAELRDFKLEGGDVSFVDQAPRPPATKPRSVRVALKTLKLDAQGLAYDDRPGDRKDVAPAKVQLNTKLIRMADAREGNDAASSIDWRGQIGLQPLLAKGSVNVQRFPVHAFLPYVDVPLRIRLQRALASYKGDVGFSSAAKGFSSSANGEVAIEDVSVMSRPDTPAIPPEELLSWHSFVLRKLTFAMAPAGKPRLDIGDAALDGFYSRLVVTEQGRLNLQDLTPAEAAAEAVAGSASAPVVAAAPASAASAPADAASAPVAPQGYDLPLDLTLGGLTLSNGKVDYTDHFIKPNYSASLTELKGSVGAFSSASREMATIALTGIAEGTAQLDISGKVNPTANPLALDIHAKASDLELAPLSPYSAKYAGYDIERGKLTMDVSYNIQPDGHLDAKNQVVLNQLTFGNKVESPTATKLPVLLAVALLKDRNGVIDINLPISGSLNDPQFSVGGLIVKVLVNLLVKAVTSPFALLTGGGGGGTDSSSLDFTPGTASLQSSGAASLDKIAKALTDRPALKMTVTGESDLSVEHDAYQKAAFEQRLLAERRRELAHDDAPADAPITLTAEDRVRLVKLIYTQTRLPDKPRNVIGMAKDIPTAEMEAMLLKTIDVNADQMRNLALQRGLAVRDALVAKGLASDRLFIAAPKVLGPEAPAGWKPQVQLSLSTK